MSEKTTVSSDIKTPVCQIRIELVNTGMTGYKFTEKTSKIEMVIANQFAKS